MDTADYTHNQKKNASRIIPPTILIVKIKGYMFPEWPKICPVLLPHLQWAEANQWVAQALVRM